MTDIQVIEILFDAFNVVTTVAGPLLAAALFIGVGVSVIQTLAQGSLPGIEFQVENPL